MNNTRTLAIVAVLTAATLVVGLTVAATMTTSAFAGGGKKGGQDKYMREGGQDGYKKDGQDKYVKRGQDGYKKDGQDTYKKGIRDNGNDGGSDSRNGNTVTIFKADNKGSTSGFDTAVNQEADNTICTHPSTNCISEGSETPVVTNNTSSDDSG
jgi:protoporphyrinogen oxidase